MKVEKDFEEFIKLLNYHKVKYVIVGAYALIYYTLPRNTGDIDIFIEASELNAGKILDVLKDFGFQSMELQKEDFLKPDIVIQLGYPPNRIDIITGVSGISFSEVYNNRVEIKMGTEKVWIISANDLLKNKKSTNRAKDKADAELLEKFLQRK